MLLLREFSSGKLSRERQIATAADTITFGRGFTCDYSFCEASPHLSRVQATLKRKGDRWELHNGNPKGLRSANGVFYKGQRLEEPLEIASGTVVDLFHQGNDLVQLQCSEAVEYDTYTGEGNLAEAITALRQDVAALANRIDERDQQIDKFLAQPIGEFQQDFNTRMNFLGVQVTQLNDAIEVNHTDLTALRDLDSKQSSQIDTHERLIRKVGLGLAAALLSLGGWNLTSGNKDAVTQSINILFALAGGTGGTYLLQKEGQKVSPKDSLKPA